MIKVVKKYYLYLVCFVVLIIGVIIIFGDENEVISTDEEDIFMAQSEVVESESEYIVVDIKGYVENPGIYKLPVGSRIMDLIETSGGVREEAELGILNLSHKLNDEDVVIVYSKAEINELKKGSTSIKIVEKECVCPKIESVGCVDESISNIENSNNASSDNKVAGRVSLNNGTKQELETLPGIGSSKAQAIIDYRDSNGGFKSIDELKEVKGIGDATYEKLKELITL